MSDPCGWARADGAMFLIIIYCEFLSAFPRRTYTPPLLSPLMIIPSPSPSMRQCFNDHFKRNVPPMWTHLKPPEIFQFIQTSILLVSNTAFGPPRDISSTPGMVATQQRILCTFLLQNPRWWSELRHVITFFCLHEQVHSARQRLAESDNCG